MTEHILFAVAVVLAGLLSTMLFLAVFNRLWGPWACRVLGWHLEPKKQNFDGCSFEGTCPRCGKHVLQDSQGNWFTTGREDTHGD